MNLFNLFRKAVASPRKTSRATGKPRSMNRFQPNLEALEDRSVPSTVAYGDFNNDGLVDMAALTNSTTITVSLANPDGSYTVSDTLSLPKSQPTNGVNVGDYDYDGDLDVGTWSSSKTGAWYSHVWLGNGDGSFGHRDSHKISFDGW